MIPDPVPAPPRDWYLEQAEDAGVKALDLIATYARLNYAAPPFNAPAANEAADRHVRDAVRLAAHFANLAVGGAAVPPPLASWQPIETAPKDGTEVLLCMAWNSRGEPVGKNAWGIFVQRGAWWAAENDGDGAWIDYCSLPSDPEVHFQPTHWMPLPEPPKVEVVRARPGRLEADHEQASDGQARGVGVSDREGAPLADAGGDSAGVSQGATNSPAQAGDGTSGTSAPVARAGPIPARPEDVTTYTPMLWVVLNEDERYAEYVRVREQLAATEAARARVQALVTMANCAHHNRIGGNDYNLCTDCGLSWDYRREQPWEAFRKNVVAALARAPEDQ